MSSNHSPKNPITAPSPHPVGTPPVGAPGEQEYQSAKGCLLLIAIGVASIAICVVAAWLFGNFG